MCVFFILILKDRLSYPLTGKKIIRPDSKTPRRFLQNLLATIGIQFDYTIPKSIGIVVSLRSTTYASLRSRKFVSSLFAQQSR